MAFDESSLFDQINSLKSQLAAAKGQYEPILERHQNFKTNFGVKEKADGSISIDFDKFVERLGAEGCAELRKVMDEKFPGAFTAAQIIASTLEPIALSPAEVLAPLVGKTVTILAVKDGKPKLRIHRKAAA